MNDSDQMLLAALAEQRDQQAQRIGFAKGQIQEALGCVEGNYWAEKALRRALAELSGETYAGKELR